MASAPRLKVPAGACDSHIHIYLGLLAGGQCWVKLSAPYQLSRSGPPNYEDFNEQARALVAAAPHRMLWGSNWPHPKVDWHPDEALLLDVLQQWCADADTVNAILLDNPAQLYGFAPLN